MSKPEDFAMETPDHCTKAYNQPCKLHPVDCGTCTNNLTCQMKADKQAHPEIFKSCRHYCRTQPSRLDVALGLQPSQDPRR